MKSAAAATALLTLALAACTQRPAPIPRERAYPRAALYEADYRNIPLPFGPDSLPVNRSAMVDFIRPGWFDIVYPAYGITVNCTLSSYSPQVLANRHERMVRNLGAARADVAASPSGMLVVASSAMRTPVQLLATDSLSWVLSAIAVADFSADASFDSIAPVVDAVAADLAHMLQQFDHATHANLRY